MKYKFYFTFLIIGLLLSITTHASNPAKFHTNLMLEEYPGYLNYETPRQGTMNAKMLLEDHTLIIELFTPAYNVHGIETAPNIRTDEEKQLVEMAKRKFLESVQQLFTFTPSNTCIMKFLGYRLENVEDGILQAQPEHVKWHHFNVRAELIFSCDETLPEKIAFTNIFKHYPRLKDIDIQFIANNSDLRRATLSPQKSVIPITRSSGTKLND